MLDTTEMNTAWAIVPVRVSFEVEIAAEKVNTYINRGILIRFQ
jgi:hypothetical protein